MTDGTPGWFRDPSDPALARWHDGEKWTDHTLVIADQNPGEEPPPPDMSGDAAFVPADPDFKVRRNAGLGSLPTWAKVGGPIAVVILIIVGVLLATGGNNSKDTTNTADTRAISLDTAVHTARKKGLDSTVTDARASALISRICTAATDPSTVDQLAADLAQLPAATTDDVRTNVEALGAGANQYCASKMRDNPDLISNLADQAAIDFTTTTTAPTLVPGTDGGATTAGTGGTSGTTVKGKTTTTVKGKSGTSTTAKPTTTTTPLPRSLPGQKCSPAGAKGVNKLSGAPMTCQKDCYGPNGSNLTWHEGSCATSPTVPPTTAGTSPTTLPGGTTGGTTGPGTTGGPTTGGTT